ncbi:MAG: dihydropteroate synthase, partial [Acidobacteriaceae bacterium]
MGILNITPDSFSDGGRLRSTAEAVETALRMFEEGAAIVDIGGESTR